jgi:hypothetical protein
MPPSAWAGWICFESEVEVEAAKDEPYCRSNLRAAQLSSEVYASCGGEGLRCNVPYRWRSLNFQYPHRVKPLGILTSRVRVARWPWRRPFSRNVAVENFFWPWQIGGREWP